MDHLIVKTNENHIDVIDRPVSSREIIFIANERNLWRDGIIKKKKKKVISILNDCCKDKKYILFFCNKIPGQWKLRTRCN